MLDHHRPPVINCNNQWGLTTWYRLLYQTVSLHIKVSELVLTGEILPADHHHLHLIITRQRRGATGGLRWTTVDYGGNNIAIPKV